jgi:hypothetical protein
MTESSGTAMLIAYPRPPRGDVSFGPMPDRRARSWRSLSRFAPGGKGTVRVKETELGAEERRLANFVDFIGEGRGSQTLANFAMVEAGFRLWIRESAFG